MQSLPQGIEFTGNAGKLRESPWLTFDLLDPEKDTVVTIERVVMRENLEFIAQEKVCELYETELAFR